MELSVIIISYNTISLLSKCLDSLLESLENSQLTDQTEIIVVDNNSNDESVLMVRRKFPKVKLIKNKSNSGFAKANNQAIGISKGKYIMLLNSDTQIIQNAPQILIEELKQNHRIAAVGCRLLNGDLSIQYSAGHFPTIARIFFWMSLLDDIPAVAKIIQPYHVEYVQYYQTPQFPDWVSGASFMFKKEIVKDVGLLDENIFMYGEEVEWCYRIKKAGWKIKYVPVATVIHAKGASSAGIAEASGILEELSFITFYYRKYYSNLVQMVARCLLFGGILLRILLFGIIGKHKNRLPIYAKAIQLVR